MGLEKNHNQHDREVVDKFVDPSTNYAMTPRDYVVRPVANNISGPITIVLPRVADAKGRFYSILARSADVVNTVTITDRNDSECWIADVVLNGKCDRALFYSDGLCWQPSFNGPGRWPGQLTTDRPDSQPPTTVATTVAPTTTQ